MDTHNEDTSYLSTPLTNLAVSIPPPSEVTRDFHHYSTTHHSSSSPIHRTVHSSSKQISFRNPTQILGTRIASFPQHLHFILLHHSRSQSIRHILQSSSKTHSNSVVYFHLSSFSGSPFLPAPVVFGTYEPYIIVFLLNSPIPYITAFN